MTRRAEKVAEAIRRLVSEILHTGLRDPRLSEIVTITRVELTPDLREAKIFYTVMGDEKAAKRVMNGLKSAANFIRKRVGNELKMRYVPDIRFRVDEKVEYGKRIERIIDEIHRVNQGEGQ